jgi:hypothetical protein
MNQLVVLNYLSDKIVFTSDGWINATQTAKNFNKVAYEYIRAKSTQEYMQALAEQLNCDTENLRIAKKGGNVNEVEQGTFLHPKLSVDFARWISPKFAIWCDGEIEKLLKSNDKRNDGSLLSHQEIITLQEIIIAAFYKEYRDLAREKHLKTYLPNNPKGYDYANSQTQRNTVCGIDKYALEQRLKEINVKYSSVEKALIKVDKFELIRIAVIDTMLHFGKQSDYAINIGNLAKELSKTHKTTCFDKAKESMFAVPLEFNKTISLLQLN